MNTISNIPFLAMAVFGLYTSHKNRLPSDLLLPYVGLSLIGLGSFFFHLTVSKYSARTCMWLSSHDLVFSCLLLQLSYHTQLLE